MLWVQSNKYSYQYVILWKQEKERPKEYQIDQLKRKLWMEISMPVARKQC